MAVSFLREFLRSSDWQQMQDLLEEAVDALILWVVSSSGRSMHRSDERYPELCQLVRGRAEGLRRCRNSHHGRFQEVKRTGQPVVSACYCGLVGFALPLILDDEIIGVAGGCHRRAESPITMEKCAELSTACGIDLKEVMDYAKNVKHMPKIEQKRFLTTLLVYTDSISLLIKWMNRLFMTLSLEDQYAAKLSSLSEIGKLAASELDWEEMLKTITGKTKSVLSVNACSVYVLDQDHQELVLIATDGLPASVVGRRIKVGEGITGHVAQTRTPAAVEDATRDPRAKSFPSATTTRKRRRVYQSILSVPLIAQERLIGVIDARTFRLKKWAQTDIDFLSIIAEQIAGIIEKDKYRMEIGRELEAARYIQAKLLPDPLPEINGYDLAAVIVPNSEVGGDYYDLIPMGEGRLAIVIADVSGKGIGAAILMANIQGLVNAYTYARSEIETKDAVFSMNNALCESTEPEKFVTMFCGILDTKTDVITYTNAGHNYPFVYRPGSGEPQALAAGGMVLGMIKDTEYSEASVQLASGDALVLYSDGVTEARNEDGDLFGVERLHKIVHTYMEEDPDSFTARQLLDQIHSAVREFSSSISFTDDLTIVVLHHSAKEE
jgi:serine phosphatase RsbU (regulator of sigma subunit)/ligand-binding sensor protein